MKRFFNFNYMRILTIISAVFISIPFIGCNTEKKEEAASRPNILFAISDDQ